MSSENKGVISFAVTAKLICVFVFAYADCWFSHEAAHIFLPVSILCLINVLLPISKPEAFLESISRESLCNIAN